MPPRYRTCGFGGLWALGLSHSLPAFSQALGANELPAANVCVLCDLGALSGDPRNPDYIGQLAEADGYIYSTTLAGGADNRGTLFRVSTQTGKLEVLHSFGRDERGSHPRSGLVAIDDGSNGGTPVLYGTTESAGHIVVSADGAIRLGGGTLFRYTPGAEKPEILHTFRNGVLAGIEPEICEPGKPCRYSPQQRLNAAPAYPLSAPVRGHDGALYGVASITGNQAFGALYKIEPYRNESGITTLCLGGPVPTDPDMSYAELQRLCLFSGANGNRPVSLVADRNTNILYGVTLGDSTNNRHGAVFAAQLTYGRANHVQSFTNLHRFSGGDGSLPYSLVFGSDNALYGTTKEGGTLANGRPGRGVVYRLTPGQGFKVLHTFTGARDGNEPIGGLVESNGYFYGATRGGGHGRGVLYRISRAGVFKPLHLLPFQWWASGRTPSTPLLVIGETFYGLTYQGGLHDAGVVFRMTGVDLPHVRQLTVPPRFTTGTLGARREAPVADQTQPALIEVYSDVTATQINPATGARLDLHNGFRIHVSNCRNPHILQFIHRTKQIGDETGPYISGIYTTRSGETYPFTTTPENPIWHTDGGAGKPNGYYDQGGSGQFQNPRIVNPPSDLTIFDAPTFAEPLYLAGARETWRASFKDYVICNCQVVAQIRLTLQKRYDPTAGKQLPLEYVGVSIILPSDPNLSEQQRAELDVDFSWANRQLRADGYAAVP